MENLLKELDPKVIHTNGNIRTTKDEQADSELKASIQSYGLLNPLLVREDPKGGYALIAGHRRLEAILALGVKKVSVNVVDATKDDALELQVVENLQRKDLEPMEEARAFQKLWLLRPEYTVKDLADWADKSVAYMTRSLSLLELNENTQGLISRGEIQPEIGHQIARVVGRQRDTIEKFATTKLAWHKRYPTLEDVKREIEKSVERSLAIAPFPKDVAYYGGTETPACAACPFNTGNQEALFDGAEKGSCTNPGCYSKRTDAFYVNLRDVNTANLNCIKFVGYTAFIDEQYGGNKEVKGYPVIGIPSEKGMKAAIEAKPEKFGFGIVKPGKYDGGKKAKVVIVSLKKKDKAAPAEQHDYARTACGERAAYKAMLRSAWELPIKLTESNLNELLNSVDGDILEVIRESESVSNLARIKFSKEDVLAALLLNKIESWELNPKLFEAIGLKNAKEIAKKATELALKEYDAKKELSKSKEK